MSRNMPTRARFEILSDSSSSDGGCASDCSVDQYSHHPLSIAARTISSSIQEQAAKHRDGYFEWLLAVNLPVGESATDFERLYYGCNLLPPLPDYIEHNRKDKDGTPPRHTLLVTPVKTTEEVLKEFCGSHGAANMEAVQTDSVQGTPVKEIAEGISSLSINDVEQATPESTPATEGDDNDVGISGTTPAKPIARIEDSFEAIDQLEDELAAFDEAAHFKEIASPTKPKSSSTVRFATPQPKRRSMAASPAVKPLTEPRRSSMRRSPMLPESPQSKNDDKPLTRTPSQRGTVKKPASLNPPKPLARSTKTPTVPTYQLPGERIAQQIKEKREARLASQPIESSATKPTMSSLRRTKSAKPATRPTFELPGEAISRRKRAEHEARLKKQEEEERQRRQFKARPIGAGVASASVPRETAASRARQIKAQNENVALQTKSGTTTKRASMSTFPPSKPVLSDANNQPPLRGREAQLSVSGSQTSRANSISTGSSSKYSSLSEAEAQLQKLRGQEVYKQTNSWAGDREREKRERETLTKEARKEAAERSRQISREWAAKQARKRMTVSSIQDLMD
ncbi:hypothetical protein F5Y15DRAFT_369053 [Xylariaceae sp. FL0016]|nr:hypothetical protein F5Y15DRAFT_369053 [Xylariaceae sp. FL0016]